MGPISRLPDSFNTRRSTPFRTPERLSAYIRYRKILSSICFFFRGEAGLKRGASRHGIH